MFPSHDRGGQAWVNPINNNLFTDASNNGSFGTFGPNGIYFKTNNTTRWYLDRNGIAPETGTSVGIGIDPADSNRITYFSGGGGSTPTWQQTLTAGSTLNISNNINSGNNTQSFSWPTLGGGNLGMYISSESSTAATGGEILLQVTTTHTPVATGITTYSAVLIVTGKHT